MTNRRLVTIVLALAAVMLFFVMLNSGQRELSLQALKASAEAGAEEAQRTKPGDIIKAVNDEIMTPETTLSLKYNQYPTTLLYFVVGEESVPVYSSPNDDKHVVRTAANREKLNYVETVVLEGTETTSGGMVPASGTAVSVAGATMQVWYHVYWYEDAKGKVLPDGSEPEAQKAFGFLREGAIEKRSIRVDHMAELAKKAGEFSAVGEISHISNYKNGNGKPALYKGKEKDAFGNSRSQSAPGYSDLADLSEFTYLADGTLIKILEADTVGYRKVLCLADEKTYYVPMKYIPQRSSLKELTKAVVIDRRNQNEAAFEKMATEDGQGEWICVSYSMATTGTTSKYAAPTPLGYYLMIEKRPQFYYYKDGTTHVQGYAPYVMRFCGGAYIHGVPVSYQYKDGKRITPPIQEYSSTLGTVPLSHKCVRNYTSHAKFLYDWYEEGKTIVVVTE